MRDRRLGRLVGGTGGLINYNANDQLATDSYDANGNTTVSNGLGYVYDFENHLLQANGITYVYDGDGNRVSKTVAGVTTNYLVDTFNPTGYAQVVTLPKRLEAKEGTARLRRAIPTMAGREREGHDVSCPYKAGMYAAGMTIWVGCRGLRRMLRFDVP